MPEAVVGEPPVAGAWGWGTGSGAVLPRAGAVLPRAGAELPRETLPLPSPLPLPPAAPAETGGGFPSLAAPLLVRPPPAVATDREMAAPDSSTRAAVQSNSSRMPWASSIMDKASIPSVPPVDPPSSAASLPGAEDGRVLAGGPGAAEATAWLSTRLAERLLLEWRGSREAAADLPPGGERAAMCGTET